MKRHPKTKNIFADKASLLPRMMLKEPEKKWVLRDFTAQQGISIGMAQAVLETMALKGYVERVKKGPDSYTLLTNREALIADWTKEYQFDQNDVDTYYSSDKNILRRIKAVLGSNQYALTLHAGANIITSFVKTEEAYLYLNLKNWESDLLDLRQKLELKELVSGGNIHIIRPLYKNSVFFNAQNINGFSVVSNLQLYLDLYGFQPRGREHAKHLKELLEKQEKHLD